MHTLTEIWCKLPRCWFYDYFRWEGNKRVAYTQHYIVIFGRKFEVFKIWSKYND